MSYKIEDNKIVVSSRINDKVIDDIINETTESNIQSIIINDSNINDGQIKKLANFLEKNRNIKILNLERNNQLTEESIKYIDMLIEKNKKISNIKLSYRKKKGNMHEILSYKYLFEEENGQTNQIRELNKYMGNNPNLLPKENIQEGGKYNNLINAKNKIKNYFKNNNKVTIGGYTGIRDGNRFRMYKSR